MTDVKNTFLHSIPLGAFWAAILALALGWPLFGTYFFHPNEHMFAFGGDPLTLYYNVTYHTCYGSGTHLANMSYPDGELIFLTDAQGSLSILLSYLQKAGLNVCDYTVGIVNSLAVWGYLLAAVLIYLIFIALEMPVWRAVVFSAFVAAMAPHLPRMIGHHGLSHTFLLPLTFLWLIRKFNVQKWEWRDLGFWFLMLFFTFNNPYSGFGLGLTVLLTGLVMMARQKKFDRHWFYVAFLGLSPLLILFSYLHFFDPFHDRIALQWGFFHYKANVEGLISPAQSLMDWGLHTWTGKGFSMDFEAIMNLGFPVSVLLLSFLGVRIFRRKWLEDFEYKPFVMPFFWATLVLFVYASALLFLPFPQDWVENVLGKLLMFKAAARLAWPFWYALIILSMALLENLLRRLSFSGFAYTIALVCITWFTDYKLYRKPSFTDVVQPNFFSTSSRAEIDGWLKTANVNPADYQGIFLLPKLMTWTDHFQSENNFFNQFFGMRLSATTGLPLVSAMLSRMSVGQTAERIEFLSDPLIEKSLHNRFPNQKPLLLLRGKGNPNLKWGENYLVSIGDTLYDHKDFTLLRLPLEKINHYSLLNKLKSGQIPVDAATSLSSMFYAYGLQSNMEKSYFGNQCWELPAGEHEVVKFKLSQSTDSIYHFSAWSYIDFSKYGLGTWSLRWYEQGNEKGRVEYNLSQSSEVHDQWVRADIDVPVCSSCEYKVYFSNNKTSWVDEILFRPASQHHYIRQANFALWDGFKIEIK